MGHLTQPSGLPNLSLVAVRPVVLFVNNVTAMTLAFLSGSEVFIALGIIMIISTIFTLAVSGFAIKQKQLGSNSGNGPKCPSGLLLGVEALGVITFFAFYIPTTLEAANSDDYWGRDTLVKKTYASIGALVAMFLHLWGVVAGLYQYNLYRRSLRKHCPHCHQSVRSSGDEDMYSAPPPPPQNGDQRAAPFLPPRDSMSANSEGEGEDERLITTKE